MARGHDHDHAEDYGHPHQHEHLIHGHSVHSPQSSALSGAHSQAHVHGHGEELDRVVLTHVGLDVGSATVKLLACRLVLAGRPGGQLRVAERRAIFRPPVLPTPYRSEDDVDVDALAGVTRDAWAGAPVALDAADTRLMVATGPLDQGLTAEALAGILGGQGFGCVRAGPHLAAVMAAYGSDAVARSVGPHGDARTILHVDLGGTVTRFALCQGGEVLDTAAVGVGPRLVVLDESGRILRLDRAAQLVADRLGLELKIGSTLAAADRKMLADELAECLFAVLERTAPHSLTEQLLVTGPLGSGDRLNGVSFSGGAAEYIYGGEDDGPTDLGPVLGRAVRQRLNRLGVAVQEPEHIMRATLLGCAQYRMEDVHGTPLLAEPAAFAAARDRDKRLVA